MFRRLTPTLMAAAALLATAALTPTGARAAGAPAHAGGGQRLRAALAELDLSADQKTQIRQILADAKAQSAPTSQPSGGNRAASRSDRRAIMEKVLGVLTPVQRAKLKQILKAGRTTGTAKA